jgi:hypothetical protein
MHRRVVTVALQRRASHRRGQLRRLRAGVFQLGGMLGLDMRAVVRFSEVISGRRWRRCCGGDLEQVVADFATLAGWRTGQLAQQRVDPEPLRGAPQERR